jgi:hypothetical protein
MVGYPFPLLARIDEAISVEGAWHTSKRGHIVHQAAPEAWADTKANVHREFLTTKGIDVGHIEVVLVARPLTGLLRTETGAEVHHFDGQPVRIPVQLIPAQGPRPDPRYQEKPPTEEGENLQKGDRVIFLGEKHYGLCGTIVAKRKTNAGKVKSFAIKFAGYMGPRSWSALAKASADESAPERGYARAHDVAKDLGLDPQVFSRLAGNISVTIDAVTGAGVGFLLPFAVLASQVTRPCSV